MIYIKLFLTFFEVGAVSFGGGYGMIALIKELVIGYGWLTESELLNFIAVSESTPGPIAINMATFIGSSKGGLLGAFMATLGVVLPSFVIILIIVSLIKNLLKYPSVQGILSGIRPCVVGLIVATALTLGLSTLFSFKTVGSNMAVNVRGLIILAIILLVHFFIKYVLKKKVKPILMIIISAVLGIIVYSL